MDKFLVVDRKSFVDGLIVGGSLAGKSKTLPILDNVKIDISGDKMFISSNSIMSYITHDVCGCIRQNSMNATFSFLINYSDFVRSVKSLRDNELTLGFQGNTLTIEHGRGVIELPTMDVTEFPTTNAVDVDRDYVIRTDKLFSWINTAKSFVANDELRPTLCGMYLYFNSDRVGYCATDTRRLVTDSYAVETFDDDASCIVPSVVFPTLQGILGDSDVVRMRLNERNITFVTDYSTLTCQLQVGNYPNFKAVIPQSNTNLVGVKKDDIIESVNRVGLFTDKSTSLIKMCINGPTIRFMGSDMAFGRSAMDECVCEGDCEPLTIGVSAEMLLQCVMNIDADDVLMAFSNEKRPILMNDALHPDKKMILMPMIIQ